MYTKKSTRDRVFSRPRLNNLISLLFWKCNGPNGAGKLAFYDNNMDEQNCVYHLQALLFSNIEGICQKVFELPKRCLKTASLLKAKNLEGIHKHNIYLFSMQKFGCKVSA